MTKTAYAKHLTPEELAAELENWEPGEEREYRRVEIATNPLFDMWLRFEDVFCDRAIDRLDVTDEDAEAAAAQMEGAGPSGIAYAYLLRQIPHRRRFRELHHKVSTVWAASGKSEAMSIPEIHARYEKLPKGEA
jgi:hypothetical protein